MIKRRAKNSNGNFMRDAHRRAALRGLLDEERENGGVPPRPVRRTATPSEPAPGARIYRVTLVTPGSENEAVQVEAVSMADAKKHATAAFLSTPGAVGIMVREVGARADDA